MTDYEALQLLTLLHQYVTEYAPDIPQTISALAEDLAMSMDRTSDAADELRQQIEAAIG